MATEREIRQRYDQAHRDDCAGKYDEALEGYLYYLDHSDGPVRLSYTLQSIMTLSGVLPAAREALEARRDRCEERILSGSGDWREIHDFTSFNKYLDEKERSLALLDRLSNADNAHPELYLKLLDGLWELVAEQGHYEKLSPIIEKEAKSIASFLAAYHIRWNFKTEGSHEYSRDLALLRNQLLKAILAYQVLIALRKDGIAEKLARWIIKCDPSGDANALLNAAAAKAGRRCE
ncbi:MAG: hypothetical protein JWQ02_1938 [Capsulimonas sp.]|jgi:hypothetical protein|nr:hypothetical protein [Capsulimonas sp.]